MQSERTARHVFFVDDEVKIHKGVKRLFRQYKVDWDCSFFSSVDGALAAMDEIEVDALVSDIKMPGRDGFELLGELRATERFHDLPVVMLTGLDNPSLKSKALDLGATDLLNKPIKPDDLLARIRSVLYIKECQDTIKRQKTLLEDLVRQRTEALEAARLEMVWRLGRAAEFRSEETGNHIIRVGYYAKILAEKLGQDSSTQEMIFLTAPLHDLGKIGIPDQILFKKGRLNAEEWAVMRTHCTIGYELLTQGSLVGKTLRRNSRLVSLARLDQENNPFLEMAADIAGYHHEHWNGNGYPHGAKQEKIPLSARIVSVADVYDALRSDRVYKPAMGKEEALSIMRRENNNHFDPAVYNAFEKSLREFDDILNTYGAP